MRIFLFGRDAFFEGKQIRIMLTALLIAALFPFAILVTPLEVQAASTTIIIPYLETGYKFKVVPFDEELGFEEPGYDESEFSLGDAGFGTQSGDCSLNNPVDAKTLWPLNTDILLRKQFNLPAGATDLKVAVAIDNDVQVFVNGEDISGGLVLHEDCPSRDSFVFAASDSILNEGDNLLSVRARDRGFFSFVDVQVTAVIGEPGPSYNLQLFEGSSPSDGVIGFGNLVRAVASVEKDPDVSQVEFRWIKEGHLQQSSIHALSSGQAEDELQVNAGEWIVEADFGNGQVIQRTLTSGFFVLPESQIGAIAMIVTSLGALGGFLYFRSRKPIA